MTSDPRSDRIWALAVTVDALFREPAKEALTKHTADAADLILEKAAES
jgi:hypothetical protein